jgi:hypothetical protein
MDTLSVDFDITIKACIANTSNCISSCAGLYSNTFHTLLMFV